MMLVAKNRVDKSESVHRLTLCLFGYLRGICSQDEQYRISSYQGEQNSKHNNKNGSSNVNGDCAHIHTHTQHLTLLTPISQRQLSQPSRHIDLCQLSRGGYENYSAVFISVQVNITGWLLLKAKNG